MSGQQRAHALVSALARYLGDMRDLRHKSVDWHSATFSGARHVLHFTLDDHAATANRLRTIADTDLPMTRGFVADIVATSLSSGAGGLAVELDVLTIVD